MLGMRLCLPYSSVHIFALIINVYFNITGLKTKIELDIMNKNEDDTPVLLFFFGNIIHRVFKMCRMLSFMCMYTYLLLK